MNKLCYRLVFNRARGLLMAVAETTRNHRASGGGRCLFAGTAVAALFWLLGLPEIAGAQIVPDRTSPANRQPTVNAAANGVPLVNIQTPTAGGVSRNAYSQFDVQRNGAILNNATQPAQTSLGGWVQANPLLEKGASVIVNEVNSSDPSLLRGYVEVAGKRAQVIIANPSGISCDGCGFINANRATLTTGIPQYNTIGNLDSYLVRRGVVNFAGDGLDAKSADYTDVIARSVQVNAALRSKQLNVIAGSNDVRAADLQAMAVSSSDGKPAFAVDVSALGGMYAGKIWLVGTESGVGMRSAGTLGGGASEIRMTSAGRIELTGLVDSTGLLNIDAAQGLVNHGTLHAGSDATLRVARELDNSDGTIAANGILSITDTAEESRSLAILNTSGTLIAGQRLSIDAASLSGDGKTLGETDVDIQLTTDYDHTGTLAANRRLTLTTTGTLNNHSTLEAGDSVVVTAEKLNNEVDGSIEAPTINLTATAPHALINRGLINGDEVLLKSRTIKNLGSGRIYGDHVALDADIVRNDIEGTDSSVTPVIAARSRLDIGADQISNGEGALLHSDGDLAIGRHLDAQSRAIGQTSLLENISATIEAMADMALAIDQISNVNAHYSTTRETKSPVTITELAGAGSAYRYAPGTPDVYVYNDESDHLHTPERNFERWLRYQYERSVTEDVTASSAPAQIVAGGQLRIHGQTLTNDKSRLLAGQDLDLQMDTVNNIDATGTRTITDSGTVTSFWRDHHKGRDSTGISHAAYEPPPVVQTISLGVVGLQDHTAPTSMRIVDISNGNGQSTRSVSLAATVPASSLYHPAPQARGYLVETDPRFANYKQWLSSDYLLQQMALDPQQMNKRLGDGFYEQKLVREQVAQLTGRHFLPGYANDEAQFQALMNNAVTFAQAYQLRPGVALSAEQMSALTSDIVWLVDKEVTLPNGQVTRALVPQVYVQVRDGDLKPDGALLGGEQVNLTLSGDLNNGGTIAGRQLVSMNATNIKNLGGTIAGARVVVQAAQDIDSTGGQIQAANTLALAAGNDITVASTTSSQSNAQGIRTNVDRVAGLYVSSDDGQMIVTAGHDLTLKGAAIRQGSLLGTDTAAAQPASASGRVVLSAGNDVRLDTVSETRSESVNWGGGNHRSESARTDVGTTTHAAGSVDIVAGRDVTARGAQVSTRDGDVRVNAARDVALTSSESQVSVDESHRNTSSGFLSSTTYSSRDTLDQTTQQGSLLSGNTVTVQAGRDIRLSGSNAASTQGITLDASRNTSIEAATNTRHETHAQQEKTSGLMGSGGFGVTIGTRSLKTNSDTTTTTAAASTVGSMQGDVSIHAGDAVRQVGSAVIAPQGNVSIAGRKVDIVEARNSETLVTDTQFKQSGITVAISNPVITAVQTAKQMSNAASNTKDDRMKALAAANTAMAVSNAYDAVKNAPADANAVDKLGKLQLSVSIGSSKSDSHTVIQKQEAAASSVGAGGNVSITALGDKAHSDVTVQGSEIAAGRQVSLVADHAVNLQAAANTQTQRSNNSSSSASVGVVIDSSGAFGANVSGSLGRGHADGADLIWSNTKVSAGQQATLQSGADTTIKGAVVAAPQVTVASSGKLSIESLQDSSTYTSRQKQVGGSATIGPAPSANANFAKSNIDSTYTSVNEQSGIKAGDGGFNVAVTGDTSLKGGAITSTQAAIDAGRNTFNTSGTLTTTDIQNRASYKAESVSANIGAGFSAQGKLAPAGTGVGIGNDSGSSTSTTRSGIGDKAGNAAMRTGDKETGIAKIFDADKVQREITAQVTITQEFSWRANKMVGEYIDSQQKALQQALKAAASDDEKQKIRQAQSDLRNTEHALNILIGAVTGVAGAAVTKEALSTAAEKMRDLMIEDSQKFKGVTDGKTTITNMSGSSDGVRHDEIKLGGTRMDLDALCGDNYYRCDAKMIDGKSVVTLDDAGLVTFKEPQAGMTLEKFLQTADGKKLEGLTGGIQGAKGTLFGIPYAAGSWQDHLIESFAGTHDLIGGKLSGLYDTNGNIVQGMSSGERLLHDRWADVAVIPSAPFAMAERLPPAVWQAISILLREAK
jgi:filamentous hemagglutinin